MLDAVYKMTQSPFAREMIERLQAVYANEAEIRSNSAEQRRAARRTRSALLMTALKARLTEVVGQLFSRSWRRPSSMRSITEMV
ncbi:transposase [Bradyrhizobium sp. UFLA05-109]